MVKGKIEAGSSARLGLGLLSVLSLLAVAATPLLSPVITSSEEGYYGGRGRGHHTRPCDREGSFIRGSLTLQELEEHTDIPAEKILEKLKLPTSIEKTKLLRHLREQYGISMQQVREAVHALKHPKD